MAISKESLEAYKEILGSDTGERGLAVAGMISAAKGTLTAGTTGITEISKKALDNGEHTTDVMANFVAGWRGTIGETLAGFVSAVDK